jgi:hypothetical protein
MQYYGYDDDDNDDDDDYYYCSCLLFPDLFLSFLIPYTAGRTLWQGISPS